MRNGTNCARNEMTFVRSWKLLPYMESKCASSKTSFEETLKMLIDFRSSFDDFAKKFSKEDHFRAIEKMRERESLFNEYIVEVRKREKEEKHQKKEQVSRFYMNFMEFDEMMFFIFTFKHL